MASRKTSDESCRQSSLPKRHLWSSSSDDEEKTEPAACCRHPPTPTDNAVLFSSSSSCDEEKMTSSHCRHPCTRRVRKPRQATGPDTLHRDNNSFSFKDFLKNGMQQTNYHNTGARPKIYASPVSSTNNDLDRDSISGNIYSNRNPTELPDFVQDHLVIEQCYLNQKAAQPILPDVDNLPDFALNSMEQRRKTRKRQSRMQNDPKGSNSDVLCDELRSVDLTGTLNQDLPHRDNAISNISHLNHLDLPTFENRLDEAGAVLTPPESRGFPFDLPLPVSQSNSTASAQNSLPGNETSVHKSLPDFLNDGPIHNKSTDPEPIANMTESAERRLLLENERLRHQLDAARREINEKTEKIHSLEAELLSKKEIVHEETAHLEKAMEEVEDNLKRSTKRAVNAESTVTSLKKEIKTLTTEISLLRLENSELRATVSVADQREVSANMNRTVRRLARDLFAAASSAEVSLRQLMSGVENLRVLASTLENVDRIEDWTKDFLLDSDEDNAAGPAV